MTKRQIERSLAVLALRLARITTKGKYKPTGDEMVTVTVGTAWIDDPEGDKNPIIPDTHIHVTLGDIHNAGYGAEFRTARKGKK